MENNNNTQLPQLYSDTLDTFSTSNMEITQSVDNFTDVADTFNSIDLQGVYNKKYKDLNSLLIKNNHVTYRDVHQLAHDNISLFYLFVILQAHLGTTNQ